MQLLSARVVGFQSFADSGELRFESGINLVVGQNNAGKSALLRALQYDLPDDRHRTPESWIDAGLPHPHTDFTFKVSGAEIQTSALERNRRIIIPIDVNSDVNPVPYGERLLTKRDIKVKVHRRASEAFSSLVYPSHGEFHYVGYGPQVAVSLTAVNGVLRTEQYNNGEDTLPDTVGYLWRTRMFYFSAERLSFGRTNVAYSTRLHPDASNLAAVLNTISGDMGDTFRRLIGHLRELFPTVGNLSTRISPENSQLVEVRIWPTPSQERPELSFPLTQSGTGVAQVIAILVAVMTIDSACIIIDEINSFLHPSAVKSLLRILQTDYSHHQYIISTHAPEVVSFANPSSIHLVRRQGYNSTVERLQVNEVDTFRAVASHLGVSMADVFAAERVIWVEGETEEFIFPYLYQHTIGPVPSGTVFTAVAATGDFGAKRRDRRMIYEAYSRLSEAVSTMPISVVFGFDTETLSDAEKGDMIRDSGGRLHFLPRRHLECYFIDADSLAQRIRDKDSATAVNAVEVEEKLLELSRSQRFSVRSVDPDLDSENWLAQVDAAKLLNTLFSELSDARIEYDKTTDGIEMVKLMLDRQPAKLAPLTEYVRELVQAVSTASAN